MNYRIKDILGIVGRGFATIVLIALLAIVVTSLSPIYDFSEPRSFSGPDIFNPYRSLDTTKRWQRANFHTHTRVEGPTNECDYWPHEVLEAYDAFDYDIVTFSNHNLITEHPHPERQVDLYEHGYNLLKYHKLVFGPRDGVMHFDHLLPILASQRQWQIDLLLEECDLIQLNHPARTHLSTKSTLQKLSGYTIMELDSGKTSENEYWDWALSAGHYSFGLANDDLHYPDRSSKIAVRCNFMQCKSASYDDIKQALEEGCYYAMRIPDYGAGDWEIKLKMNRTIPYIKQIGVEHNTIYASFSEPAESITLYGANHTILSELNDSCNIEYCLPESEPYARIVAKFEDGEILYTNPFARYDSSLSDKPDSNSYHTINWALTIAFNTLLGFIALLTVALIIKMWQHKKQQR